MALWKEFTCFKPDRPAIRTADDMSYHKQGALILTKCPMHGHYQIGVKWERLRTPEDADVFNEVWKWSSHADKQKSCVAVSHLIWHLRSEKVMRGMFDRALRFISPDLHNVTACALLIHAIGNQHSAKVFALLEKYKLCCLGRSNFKDAMKALSVALRRTGYWPDGTKASLEEVTSCSAWELALGRSSNKSDWEEEKRKRTEQVLHLGDPLSSTKSEFTNNEFLSYMDSDIREVVEELVPSPKGWLSWRDYLEDRQSWSSSGSTGGKKFTLESGESVRMNKHMFYETQKLDDMIGWLNSEPKMVATASEKFEMGKSRAIYGTQIDDFTICSYVLDAIESNLSNVSGVESGLLGLDFLSTMVRRVFATTGCAAECTCIDYADFNYQHTLEVQGRLFDQLANVLASRGYHPDKVKACAWVAAALRNQWSRFPGNPKQFKITQGMFSGCRGTNFINTMLNVVYFRACKRMVFEMFNLEPVKLYNIHQGDDVWISNQDRLWAIALYNVMLAAGFELQNSKQMFDIARGEFLRVMYTGGGSHGFVARAIGTLIIKPIQSTMLVSPSDRATSMSDQIQVLYRRGLTSECCSFLWKAIVPYAGRLTVGEQHLSIPVNYMHKDFLDGGLDIGPPHTAARKSNSVCDIPKMRLGSQELESQVPTNMSRDWANRLSRNLKTSIDYDRLVDVMHRTNVTDSLRDIDRQHCLLDAFKDIKEWLSGVDIGPVNRDRATFDELLQGEQACAHFIARLDQLCTNQNQKRTVEMVGMLDMIQKAIISSPFKGLANAKVATGLGDVDAALVAIMNCPSATLQARAIEQYNRIKVGCGDAVLAQLLQGVRAGASKYQSELHPVILSWIQGYALEVSVQKLINTHEQDVERMRRRIADDMAIHVRTALRYDILRDISRY